MGHTPSSTAICAWILRMHVPRKTSLAPESASSAALLAMVPVLVPLSVQIHVFGSERASQSARSNLVMLVVYGTL